MPSNPGARAITVENVSKSFESLPVLEAVSLHVQRGEFVSILGPSGCGKTTLFSVLTGLQKPDSGQLLIDDEPLRPSDRPFAWMPQRDALLPWRTVSANVALGAEVARGMSRQLALKSTQDLLNVFGVAEFADALPHELSGGMRQRVALARTIAQNRNIALLDEPFGALDALTRVELQMWLESIWSKERWSVVLITHDVREAVLLSDRIYVLSHRPARVMAEFTVPLERPRSVDMLASPEIAALEVQLLHSLGGVNPDQ